MGILRNLIRFLVKVLWLSTFFCRFFVDSFILLQHASAVELYFLDVKSRLLRVKFLMLLLY